MRSYEPVSSVHRALVVDPQALNFADTRLDVHCVPRDLLINGRSNQLCRHVAELFESQGAVVNTVSRWRRTEVAEGETPVVEEPAEDEVTAVGDPRPVQLFVEIRARELSKKSYPLSWFACLASFTLIPAVTESTFVQEVVVRDAERVRLLEDRAEGRVRVRAGAGAWLSTLLLDRVWKKKKDKQVGVSVTKDLTRDLDRQLSQAVYQAKLLAPGPSTRP